jgi:tRNA(Ile)-lysidine synthase
LAFRILRQMILGVRGRLGGITYQHMESILRLVGEGQSGQRAVLPGGFEVRREFDWLIVGRPKAPSEPDEYGYTFRCPAGVPLPHLGVILHFKIVESEAFQRAYNEEEVACFDAANLADELVLRNWRPGDRFEPVGCRKPQKLKELFRSRRIGAASRRGWPVLVSGNEIIWVREMPVARMWVPGNNTRIVLVVQESPMTMAHDTKN